MVSEGGGGTSSDSGSDRELASDSDFSDDRLYNLVDELIGKLSIYPADTRRDMTIKNRKDRLKPDRQSDRDSPGSSSSNRHSYGFKPYPYNDERKENMGHRSRLRLGHPHESPGVREAEAQHTPIPFPNFPLVEPTGYQAQSTFAINQSRLLPPSQQHETSSGSCDGRPVRDSKSNQGSPRSSAAEDGTGNNSEDEYYFGKHYRRSSVGPDKNVENNLERLLMEKKGWKIVKVGADGACLFRSVSHQIFGDEEKHDVVRSQVIDYMVKNKEHFSQYVTEDFEHYISRKRDASSYGNHLEIQAIAELYNRPVEIYHNSVEPINVFHAEYSKESPIRLSYHGRVHYNSVVDPFNPTFGHGLGMPNYQPGLAEPDLIAQAITESEVTHLEEAMLRDKLAETEQQEIEQCIEDQAVRESYYDYINHFNLPVPRISEDPDTSHHSRARPIVHKRNIGMRTSNPVSGFDVASSSKTCLAASHSSQGAATAKSPSLIASSSQKQQQADSALLRHMPAEMLGMEEDALMAMVLEQSRHEYLANLRQKRTSPCSTELYSHSSDSPNPLLLGHGSVSNADEEGPREATGCDIHTPPLLDDSPNTKKDT